MARPLIGPKVQTQVDEEIKKWAVDRAKKIGAKEADVVRELVTLGYQQATKVEA